MMRCLSLDTPLRLCSTHGKVLRWPAYEGTSTVPTAVLANSVHGDDVNTVVCMYDTVIYGEITGGRMPKDGIMSFMWRMKVYSSSESLPSYLRKHAQRLHKFHMVHIIKYFRHFRTLE
jgi:hypothetical protein